MSAAERRRNPDLDADRITRIVRVISRLPGKPTWREVVEGVERELGAEYTRQALHAHEAVRAAYTARRNGAPAKPGSRPVSKALSAANGRVAASEARVEAARRREDALIETFARWLYNARAAGITQEVLDKPLPPNHRR